MKNKANLTKIMQKTLIDLFKDNEYSHCTSTIKALAQRDLITDPGKITSEGRELAITYLSLEQQCEQLEIPIYEFIGPYNSKPEHFLWIHFKGLGFYAAYCEGGAFLSLIKAAALPVLIELNTFYSKDDACKRFLEAQFYIHKKKSLDILKAIEHASVKEIQNNFQEIYRYSIVQKSYPGLEKDFISALFNVVGSECLLNIAKLLFEDPYSYRNGWPDLTLIKDGKLWLLEVKTTDRFHLSQIKTITKIKKIIPAHFGVIHLKQGSEFKDYLSLQKKIV